VGAGRDGLRGGVGDAPRGALQGALLSQKDKKLKMNFILFFFFFCDFSEISHSKCLTGLVTDGGSQTQQYSSSKFTL
jgi:hypothetical protein